MGLNTLIMDVRPTGDMARKAPYDRDVLTITEYYVASLPAHGWTTRWTYTVPTDRMYCNSIFSLILTKVIATAGRLAVITVERGAAFQRLSAVEKWSATQIVHDLVITPVFYLLQGDYLMGRTYANDTVNHSFYITLMGLEFDV